MCERIVAVGWSDDLQIDLLRNGVTHPAQCTIQWKYQDCLNTAGSLHLPARSAGAVMEISLAEDSSVTVTQATTDLPLQGTTWFLESYFEGIGASVGLLPGTSITAIFGANGQLSGSAGCNTYSATYTTDSSSLFNRHRMVLPVILCRSARYYGAGICLFGGSAYGKFLQDIVPILDHYRCQWAGRAAVYGSPHLAESL